MSRGHSMKAARFALAFFVAILVGAQAAADRRWHSGMCTQVGIARTLYVADVVHERLPPTLNTPQRTEVATYVIETDDRRYHLQAMVAIGSDEFAAGITVGSPVTIAIEKKTAYIKREQREYRLLVRKNERKKAS
jgi:hypothetical protein